MTDETYVLVVLGLDVDGKPHAAVFDDRDAEPVAKAARLMGFRAVRITDAKLRQVASKLPEGRLFATGRGLVPFVKRTLYPFWMEYSVGWSNASGSTILMPRQ